MSQKNKLWLKTQIAILKLANIVPTFILKVFKDKS